MAPQRLRQHLAWPSQSKSPRQRVLHIQPPSTTSGQRPGFGQQSGERTALPLEALAQVAEFPFPGEGVYTNLSSIKNNCHRSEKCTSYLLM